MLFPFHSFLLILIIIVNIVWISEAAPKKSRNQNQQDSQSSSSNNNNLSCSPPHLGLRRCFDYSSLLSGSDETLNESTKEISPLNLLEALQATQCRQCFPPSAATNNSKRDKKNLQQQQQQQRDDDKTGSVAEEDDEEVGGEEGDEKRFNNKSNHHVAIFVTDDRIEIIHLAAALLTSNFTVTLLHLQEFSKITNLESRIWSHLSCEEELEVKEAGRLFVLEPDDDDVNSNVVQGEHEADQQSENSEKEDDEDATSASPLPSSSCRVTAEEPYDMCTIQAAGKHIQQIYNLFAKLSADGTPQIPFPDVLVMDITFVGGLLLSEVSYVPTVAIASPHALKLAIEHDPRWTPNLYSQEWNWLYRLYRIFCQRLYSLSLTKSFLAMNAIRGRLGLYLRLLKTPIDYLNPVVALILEDVPSESIPIQQHAMTTTAIDIDTQWSQRALVLGSLQPPCVPCLGDDNDTNTEEQQSSYLSSFTKKKPTTTKPSDRQNHDPPKIVICPGKNISPASARNLIRGSIVARDSLRSYDECDWDSLSCQNAATNFDIVWLDTVTVDGNASTVNANNSTTRKKEEDDYFPDVVPTYIRREKSISLLDSLARHSTAQVVLAHCDSTSSIVPTFGISLLCISQSTRGDSPTIQRQLPLDENKEIDPRELAIQLLRSLRERNNRVVASSTSSGDDDTSIGNDSEEGSTVPLSGTSTPSTFQLDVHSGMDGAVSVLREIANSHRTHGPWASLSQMQEFATQAARNGLAVGNPSPSNVDERDRSATTTTSSLNNHFDEEHPYDTFTVLVAWLVLLSCGTYVVVKDSVLAKIRRPHYNHRHHHRSSQNHGGEAFSDGILSRMPDLDDAATIFIRWAQEDLQFMPPASQENTLNGVTGGGGNTNINQSNPSTSTNRTTAHSPGGLHSPNNHSSNNRHQGQSNVRRRRKR